MKQFFIKEVKDEDHTFKNSVQKKIFFEENCKYDFVKTKSTETVF